MQIQSTVPIVNFVLRPNIQDMFTLVPRIGTCMGFLILSLNAPAALIVTYTSAKHLSEDVTMKAYTLGARGRDMSQFHVTFLDLTPRPYVLYSSALTLPTLHLVTYCYV